MDAFRRDQKGSGSPHSEPAINAPAVVLVLGAIMVAVHLVIQFLPQRTADWTVLALAFIPTRYSGMELAIPGGQGAAYWSFITHMFVHVNWLHLGVNGLFMVAFGSVLARRFGSPRFLLFSALAGIGGALAHLVSYWGEFAVAYGASAAVSGQMAGAVRLLFSRPRSIFDAYRQDPETADALSLSELLRSRRALTFIGVWIALMIFTGAGNVLAPEGVTIAWQAHLGGFLVGLLAFDRLDPLHKRAGYEEND